MGTLCKEKFFNQVQQFLVKEGKLVSNGTIVDASIVEASNSTKNREKSMILRCTPRKRIPIGTLVYAYISVHIHITALYTMLFPQLQMKPWETSRNCSASYAINEPTGTIVMPLCYLPAQIYMASVSNRGNLAVFRRDLWGAIS